MQDAQEPISQIKDLEEKMRKTRGIALLIEETIRRLYDDKHPKSLHQVQWSVLRYLSRAGEQTRNQAGLAKFLGITSGPASRTAKALEQRALIESVPNPTDSRSKIYSLTDQGRQELDGDPIDKAAQILADYTDEELMLLARILDDMSTKLGQPSR